MRKEGNLEAYYTQAELWAMDRYEGNTDQRLRARVIASLVDPEVDSILDVGCGNGFVTRRLVARHIVVGLDPSEAGLAHFSGASVVARGEALPFADGSFDAVVCAEVLEHLPEDVFAKAVSELARVAKTRLVIGVPFRENLLVNMTRCSGCGQRFHLWLHQRSFRSPQDLVRLFPGWSQMALCLVSASSVTPGWLLPYVRKALLGSTATSPLARCPRCGSGQPAPSLLQTSGSWGRRLREALAWRLPQRIQPAWMIVLLGRKAAQAGP